VRKALKDQSTEVIERVVRVLAQCGVKPQEIVEATRLACDEIPRKEFKSARGAPMELSDAAHVLTVWFSEPAYLDDAGNPRALALNGAGPSVTSLVESVNRSLDAREVVRYLVRAGAVKRVGARYVAVGRTLMLRGTRGPAYFRNLRGLLGMLRTFGHNDRPQRQVRGRFEFLVENPNVPVSARPEFDRFLGNVGMGCLCQVDGELRRLELTRKPGEPTVRLGVGIFRFEDEEESPRASQAKRRPSSRSGKRRR
jgi:hypothetical protein